MVKSKDLLLYGGLAVGAYLAYRAYKGVQSDISGLAQTSNQLGAVPGNVINTAGQDLSWLANDLSAFYAAVFGAKQTNPTATSSGGVQAAAYNPNAPNMGLTPIASGPLDIFQQLGLTSFGSTSPAVGNPQAVYVPGINGAANFSTPQGAVYVAPPTSYATPVSSQQTASSKSGSNPAYSAQGNQAVPTTNVQTASHTVTAQYGVLTPVFNAPMMPGVNLGTYSAGKGPVVQPKVTSSSNLGKLFILK